MRIVRSKDGAAGGTDRRMNKFFVVLGPFAAVTQNLVASAICANFQSGLVRAVIDIRMELARKTPVGRFDFGRRRLWRNL